MAKQKTFEEALERLDEIVTSLDGGNCSLDESLKLYEEGVKLIRLCSARLDEAQMRVKVLQQGDAGEPVLVDFNDGEE